MRRQKPTVRMVKLAWAWGLSLVFGAASLTAQESVPAQASSSSDAPASKPGEQSTPSLAGALHDLQAQMNELNGALRELRSEVASSRQESLELRRELAQTRQKLATFEAAAGQASPALYPVTESVPAVPDRVLANAERPAGQLTAPAAGPHPSLGTAAPQSQASQQAEDKLNKLAEDQQLLSSKVNEQYQTKVESASRYRVRLSGIALINVFENRGSVDNQDLPALAREPLALESSGSFGATVRQSSLGLEVFGPKVGSARTSGDMTFDFFGGFTNNSDGVAAGLVRLRTARIRFDWPRTSIIAGQDTPFISPQSPTSLASLALPALSYAGNLWTWTPQVRVERRIQISDESGLLLQGGILDPLDGQLPYGQYYRYPQAGENSRQPAYAARVAWNDKVWGGPLTLGIGSYYSRQDWGLGRRMDAWAATADWDIPLGRWFSLSGEFYRGRALGGLGSAEGRSIVFSGPLDNPATLLRGLNTAGGWSQLKFRATQKLEFNGAFGEDVPFTRDLNRYLYGASYLNLPISRNESEFLNVIYHARSNVLLSAEYRRLRTSKTGDSQDTADHINLGVGVLF